MSDTYRPPAEASGSFPPGRGLKRREDDQMSVESVEPKRPDLASSTEKVKSKSGEKSGQGKSGKSGQNKTRPK